MGWNSPDECARADYHRDNRKHDTAPLPPLIDLAMEVAVQVKNTPNLHAASSLIERYAAAEVARAGLDATLERVGGQQRRRLAVASLLGCCEAICEAGALPFKSELALRERVAETLSAFAMNAANREEREHA